MTSPAERGPLMAKGADRRLRVATVNVGTLTGKLAQVLDDAAADGIDVVCMQETRLTVHSMGAARGAAESRGWSLLARPAPLDIAGRPTGGLAILGPS